MFDFQTETFGNPMNTAIKNDFAPTADVQEFLMATLFRRIGKPANRGEIECFFADLNDTIDH